MDLARSRSVEDDDCQFVVGCILKDLGRVAPVCCDLGRSDLTVVLALAVFEKRDASKL